MKTAVTGRGECARIKAAVRRKEDSMKSLVIAEKPSVARDIARVLKCGKNINGAIEGERYVVTWGLGHLVTLADPEAVSYTHLVPCFYRFFHLNIKRTEEPLSLIHI